MKSISISTPKSAQWTDPETIDKRCPHEQGLWSDAAQVAVAAGPVVEGFNVIEDIRPSQFPGWINTFSDALFLQRTEGHMIFSNLNSKPESTIKNSIEKTVPPVANSGQTVPKTKTKKPAVMRA